MTDYDTFLARKAITAASVGFTVEEDDINPKLFVWQNAIVRWALRRGRAAIFSRYGTGKTFMQLEWARHVSEHTDKPVLILAPLAVAQQTMREGDKLGISVTVCRKQADVQDGVNITNYEMLQHFDLRVFGGLVSDESSILKAMDGKLSLSIIDAVQVVDYRLACTATPAPNDHMELGMHSAYLGIMTRSEMLSMFFVHDGSTAQEWWYVAAICELADIPLGSVLARNIAKLECRYPNGYSSADSKARIDAADYQPTIH